MVKTGHGLHAVMAFTNLSGDFFMTSDQDKDFLFTATAYWAVMVVPIGGLWQVSGT